jgi:hypothetical protein
MTYTLMTQEQATTCGSVIAELYSAAKETIFIYIEEALEADENFFKALDVVALIEDGESSKALSLCFNY